MSVMWQVKYFLMFCIKCMDFHILEAHYKSSNLCCTMIVLPNQWAMW